MPAQRSQFRRSNLVHGGGSLLFFVQPVHGALLFLVQRVHVNGAVPLFEHTGTVSRHGIKLLFEPWRHLEDVDGTQEEVETVNQRRRRLEIFPCSLIRYAEDEDDDTDDVS